MIRSVVVLSLMVFLPLLAQAQTVTLTRIASGLENPRGVVVMPDGSLLLAEAGLGDDPPGEAVGTGKISRLSDANGDGDYDDPGEREDLADHFPSYNSLNLFRTGHDEVFGLSDLVLLPDGRLFLTQDDPFNEPGHAGFEDAFYGNTGVFELTDEGAVLRAKRIATLNSFVYDAERQLFYVTESGLNQITGVTLDGEEAGIVELPNLGHDQQPVPAGIALDPRNGDVLVALFSGYLHDYFGGDLSYMPGDSKVVRIDPETGNIADNVTGLTTAIDVAVDPDGNLFVVEMTTTWPPAFMPYEFDLYAPDAAPDPGGYSRYTGRVTLFPADGSAPVILARDLDTPTNVTYHEGRLYVSTGQGTPGRPIVTPEGRGQIEGALYLIEGF